jgi:hypothetical protein
VVLVLVEEGRLDDEGRLLWLQLLLMLMLPLLLLLLLLLR